MRSEQESKAEILGAATALLRQDDEERAERLRRGRRNGLLTAILIVCLLFAGVASLVVIRHGRGAGGARSAEKTTVDGVR